MTEDEKIIRRLDELVNQLSKENEVLREAVKPRGYSFSPEQLDAEELEIIGKYAGTPILELIEKWFKTKADINNDMLIHNHNASEFDQSLWRLAVLMYDDWYTFIKSCKQKCQK